MPLTGDAKRRYHREYMRRRRAEEERRAREKASEHFQRMWKEEAEIKIDQRLRRLMDRLQSDNQHERHVAADKVYERMKKLKITWDDVFGTRYRE